MRAAWAGAVLLVAVIGAGCTTSSVPGTGSVTSTPMSSGSGVTSAPTGADPTPTRSPGGTSSSGAVLRDPARVRTVIASARQDLVDINSYDYRHLDVDLQRGLAVSTSSFRGQYRETFRTLQQHAVQLKASQRATVLAVGVGAIDSRNAALLAIVHLDNSSSSGTDKTDTAAVGLHLQQVSGHWLVSSETSGGSDIGAPVGTSALDAAVAAGRSEVVRVLSLHRAGFQAEYARVLSGASGPLRTELRRNEASTRHTLVSGGFDLSGSVSAVGVASAAGSVVRVLISAQGSRVGSATAPTPEQLLVTVTYSHGRWSVSDLRTVGLH